jgi:hypothetical protein
MLGTVPDGADLGAVSTIPVAGLTAVHVLRRMGQLLGRRVMITGASGGVGRYAIQLAARAGAEVVAISANPAQTEGLRELGAHEVHASPAEVDRPVFAVLDNVGGQQLVDAFAAVQAGGVLVNVGRSSGANAVFPPAAMLATEGRHDRSIRTFFLLADPAADFSADLTWPAVSTLESAGAARGLVTPTPLRPFSTATCTARLYSTSTEPSALRSHRLFVVLGTMYFGTRLDEPTAFSAPAPAASPSLNEIAHPTAGGRATRPYRTRPTAPRAARVCRPRG